MWKWGLSPFPHFHIFAKFAGMKEEQILVRITGQDRPGLTAAVMGILARYDAQVLDIGQADIHNTLSWVF